MIIDTHTKVQISNNRKFYENLGFSNLKQGTVIDVPISNLPKNSQKKLTCSCDKCGTIFERQYQLLSDKEFHLCKPCAKKSNGEKSGIKRTKENIDIQISNIENLKDWIKNNCFRKDGKITSHSTKIEWFKTNHDTKIYDLIVERTNYLQNPIFLQRYYDILNDIHERKLCKCCDNPAIFFKSLQKGYSEYCSNECSSKDPELNKQRIELHRESILEKYGVENISYLEETKQKISKKTKGVARSHLSGVNHHSQNNFSEEQLKYINDPNKIYNTHIEEKIPITVLSKQLGLGETTLASILKRNDFSVKRFNVTYPHKILSDWLKEYAIVEDNNRKILDGKEIDIFLPEFNLGIEINGVFWHGETNPNIQKLSTHLLEKTELAADKGIKLLHFYDSEIIEKLDIVKSIILSALGKSKHKYHARKCTVQELSSKEAFNFFKETHLKEPIYCKYNYGLMYDGELVSVIGLSKSRTSSDFEIIRFSNKLYSNVSGGFDKLLTYTIKQLNITDNLISFVDRRMFSGNSYKNKFNLIKISKPNFYYYKKESIFILESRNKYQRHKLKSLYEKGILDNYDDNWSASKIMIENGYFRIYDCGNYLYKLKLI